MAQITPWDIWGDFNRQLGDRRAAEKLAVNQFALQGLRDAGDAQAATTLFNRQVAKDETDFGQAQTLQEDRQRFTSEENRLKDERAANNKRRGRAGYVTQPGDATTTASVPAGGNKYTPQYAYSYLTQQRGIPPIVAAGIVGNVAAESGWDPAVFEGRRLGDNGTAYGAAQWRGSRQANLFKFAQSQGHARPTFEDQLDFFIYEAQSGTDPQATQALQQAAQAKSAEEAAHIIMNGYERPLDQSSAGVRMAAARSVFSGGGDPIITGTGGGTGGAVAVPGQRRYVGDPPSTPFPTGAEQQTQVEAAPADSGDFYAPQRPWTVDDYMANGITNRDLLGIPEGMDVVGTEFYSGAQLELMDPSMQRLLHPVGGYSPDETNQYLVLQPNDRAPQTTQDGLPIETGRDNAIGGGSQPDPTEMPVAADTGITAPDVPVQTQDIASLSQPSTVASEDPMMDESLMPTAMPASASPVTGNAPTGQRTRRNAQGQLEFLIDGQWRPSGG